MFFALVIGFRLENPEALIANVKNNGLALIETSSRNTTTQVTDALAGLTGR